MLRRLLVHAALQLRDRIVREREPDMTLRRHDGEVYMHRWYVWRRNRVLCLYLHKFVGSDDDRALHDHPGRNFSFIVEGGYYEVTPEGTVTRRAGDFVTRRAEALHRVLLWPTAPGDHVYTGSETDGTLRRVTERPCWTLFVFGPKYRKWGFACPRGWIPHDEFHDRGGCGES